MDHDRPWEVIRRRAGAAVLVLGIVTLTGCMVVPRPIRDDDTARLYGSLANSAGLREHACTNFACEL